MWGGKGNYEKTGAYTGMAVTHLFQVMAFVAIEPPTALEPLAISEVNTKVFRSMLPVEPSHVIRCQYTGYREEDGVARDSDTETFIALKVGIDNWRWAGVSIYLRTGKKLGEGLRIISIAFKEAPKTMFPPWSAARRGCQWCLCDTWPFLMDRYPPGSLAGRRLLRRCTPGDPRACV
jgi:glucose-6-phosphate 1-dehydrogenase